MAMPMQSTHDTLSRALSIHNVSLARGAFES
jgi:hypothetical protein